MVMFQQKWDENEFDGDGDILKYFDMKLFLEVDLAFFSCEKTATSLANTEKSTKISIDDIIK